MSIESLKAQARRHEQKEEWQKALDEYGKAIAKLEADEQPDPALFNRVADLCVRVGNYEKGLAHYERAVSLYRDAYLPNNAIAVCKKIVRNMPARSEVYLTLGQLRAEQGFLPEARADFLKYAELMQGVGDLDESFRALIEFCDLVPDEIDLRVTVAERMLASDRGEEGVLQLGVAYRTLKEQGRDDRAFGLESRMLEVDPETDFDALLARAEAFVARKAPDLHGYGDAFIPPGGGFANAQNPPVRDTGSVEDTGDRDAPLVDADILVDADVLRDADALVGTEADAFEASTGELEPAVEGEAPEEDSFEVVDLPLMALDDDVPVEGAWPLELVEAESLDDEDDGAVDLPLLDIADDTEDGPERGEDVLDVPELPILAGTGDYVDLSSMIFGDEPEEPKTTRFRVQYQEPTGDEAADFQKMLSQFKEKVSENLDASDVRAHHDLGTAYKEMGLLDEAVAEFQSALRASADHLPTYEMLGQTFLEMGKYEAAVKSLERALRIRPGVEDEFLGIYYYLARAYEQLGQKEASVEFYDRIFSLDINFADVTERLRALR